MVDFLICLASILSTACTAVPSSNAVPVAVVSENAMQSTPTQAAIQSANVVAADATQALQQTIADYQRIVERGGWPQLGAGPALKAGSADLQVAVLRVRLIASGDLSAAEVSGYFDDVLDAAVRHFQARHGLTVDGIVGQQTQSALDVSVADRLQTLRINLERLLAKPRIWGSRYVVVNIPDARYRLVDNGATVMDQPAIVGRPNWPTPTMDNLIDSIVLNPTWTVPSRIVRLELMPRIRRDSRYLAAHHMKVVNGMIQQAPGPDNPLGFVKFVFPNDDSIYLHDTNAPSQFNRERGFLSHGCIRAADALTLARHLLRIQPGQQDRLVDRSSTYATTSIHLTQPVPIHIVYDTAWVGPDGTVNFRQDIYNRD